MEHSEKDISDEDLIKGYLAGSSGDFECLYARYRKQLYAYLNALLEQDRSRVDDVFQQTWLKVIDHLPRYRHQGMFLAYLMRIGHNLAMDVCRKKQTIEQYERPYLSGMDTEENRKKNDPGIVADERYMPGKNMDDNELATAIEKAVNHLKQELKEVFLLRMEDLSFKEIARIQNCSINTVLARMQYALRNLRESLKDWDKENN
ncbi:MAG: sigma-70 family RNA polymerase sigma factor [Lentisphaeria bacterium]|nr:sigma-70 family RNA polymerase sigma factor [Lentisphaeria bacterium]